jgi:DNA mismatch repair ATPase MutS
MHDIAQRIQAGFLHTAAANLSVGVSFDTGKPVFDYKVREGASQKSYGMELAESMGLGSEQLDNLIRGRIENGELPSIDTRMSSGGSGD